MQVCICVREKERVRLGERERERERVHIYLYYITKLQKCVKNVFFSLFHSIYFKDFNLKKFIQTFHSLTIRLEGTRSSFCFFCQFLEKEVFFTKFWKQKYNKARLCCWLRGMILASNVTWPGFDFARKGQHHSHVGGLQ